MSKEVPYFKFNAGDWLGGTISFEPPEVQGIFISICADYWNKKGHINIEELREKLEKKYKLTLGTIEGGYRGAIGGLIDHLISKKFISVDSATGQISIKFLEEQFHELDSRYAESIANGTKGYLAKLNKIKKKNGSHPIPPLEGSYTPPIPYKTRQDKEKKINEISFSDLEIISNLRGAEIWRDEVCLALRISHAQFAERLEAWWVEAAAAGKKPETEKDAKSYFFYWVRQNPPKVKKMIR